MENPDEVVVSLTFVSVSLKSLRWTERRDRRRVSVASNLCRQREDDVVMMKRMIRSLKGEWHWGSCAAQTLILHYSECSIFSNSGLTITHTYRCSAHIKTHAPTQTNMYTLWHMWRHTCMGTHAHSNTCEHTLTCTHTLTQGWWSWMDLNKQETGT